MDRIYWENEYNPINSVRILNKKFYKESYNRFDKNGVKISDGRENYVQVTFKCSEEAWRIIEKYFEYYINSIIDTVYLGGILIQREKDCKEKR